jgi:hypothetical protein
VIVEPKFPHLYNVTCDVAPKIIQSFICGANAIDLGNAVNFVILAKSGVSTVPDSVISGDVGVSPIATTAMTGFSFNADASGAFSTSAQGNGLFFGADMKGNTPAMLTLAVSHMEAAYTVAAGRFNGFDDRKELGAGNIGGMTLQPGTYTWTTGINIPTDLILNGSLCDVFVFQTTGILTLAPNVRVTLQNGVQAANVFWQVATSVVIDTGAHIEGTILAGTKVEFLTGSSLNGRVYSQTAVTLQKATITQSASPIKELNAATIS